jgi:hypothetical protein
MLAAQTNNYIGLYIALQFLQIEEESSEGTNNMGKQ